jgi:excisionase family DNA binding protein
MSAAGPVRPRRSLEAVGQSNPLGAVVELALSAAALDAIAVRVADLLADRHASTGPEPWIGVEDAAHHLACSPKRIYDLKAQGRVPHRKDGSRVLFRRSDLDAYLDAPA